MNALAMAGWALALILLGLIAGVVLAWRVLPRPLRVAELAPAPELPESQKPTIYTPLEPEEVAARVLQDDVRKRMVADFMERDRLSQKDAEAAYEQVADRVQALGAEGGW